MKKMWVLGKRTSFFKNIGNEIDTICPVAHFGTFLQNLYLYWLGTPWGNQQAD